MSLYQRGPFWSFRLKVSRLITNIHFPWFVFITPIPIWSLYTSFTDRILSICFGTVYYIPEVSSHFLKMNRKKKRNEGNKEGRCQRSVTCFRMTHKPRMFVYTFKWLEKTGKKKQKKKQRKTSMLQCEEFVIFKLQRPHNMGHWDMTPWPFIRGVCGRFHRQERSRVIATAVITVQPFTKTAFWSLIETLYWVSYVDCGRG